MTDQDNDNDYGAVSPMALLNEAYGLEVAVGSTAKRPGNPAPGQCYYDTDIGLPIWWWNGWWCNALGMWV